MVQSKHPFLIKISTLYRRLVSLFIKKPNRTLQWDVKDFEWGKRWCMYQDHPTFKDKTLWDYVYNIQDDSTWTIHRINNHLGY